MCCLIAIFHLKTISLAFVKLRFSILKTSKLQPMLSTSNAEMVINAFMASRLDYCNALLGGSSY